MNIHISNQAQTLPAYQIAPQVNLALQQSPRLVITAPPGAGKSTLLPLTILPTLTPPNNKILILEPRRLAARQIAQRLAQLISQPLGQTIGYTIRFDSLRSPQTQIEVLTEGILTRRLIADPTLDGIGAIIFDEFHERNLFADTALALTLQAQQILRPDLRIILMSATIDTTAICQQLNAPLIQTPTQQHPVQIHHLDDTTPLTCPQDTARAILHAHANHPGDILAFLPGETEIRKTQTLLLHKLPNTHILPLYGQLPQTQQQQAIAPSQPGQRKIVLSTPIAETSLTIQGIRIVIDTGLCRQPIYNPQTGLTHLQTTRITLDMANQRTGRAARLAPGVCYRLWTPATQHRMLPNRQPEILTADLAPLTLQTAAWGETNPQNLPWLTPPPPAHIAQAQQLLQLLDATNADNHLTPHGHQLAQLPCHPRIAQMITLATTPQLRALAADIAALLDERDPLAQDPTAGTDITLRIEALRRARLHPANNPNPWTRITQIAHQYQHLTHAPANPDPNFNPTDAGLLLAAAYPERIASAQPAQPGLYHLSSGNTAQLPHTDPLATTPWIVAAHINPSASNPRIHLAAPLNPADLQPLTQHRDTITWDPKQGQIIAQRQQRIGNLILATKPLPNPDPQLITQTICQAITKDGLRILDFNDTITTLQQRAATVAQWHPELHIPDISTPTLLATAPTWLPPYIRNATTTQQLKHINLLQAIQNLIPHDLLLAINHLAPEHLTAPSGSKIRIQYRPAPQPPILRVRLQEIFGLARTPTVNNGLQPILLEILSPGFKPVQLTQDLPNFWTHTYHQIRRELQRRYPRHAWPDNPLTSTPLRGPKKT